MALAERWCIFRRYPFGGVFFHVVESMNCKTECEPPRGCENFGVCPSCGWTSWVLVIVTISVGGMRPAFGQEVLNLPGDPAPASITAGTTVNVFEGGELPSRFVAEAGSIVNVLGGTIGYGFTVNGANVYISDGSTSRWYINDGSIVEIVGGYVGEFDANAGSTVHISGGNIGWSSASKPGSSVTISGGTFRTYSSGGATTITGGHFANFGAGQQTVIMGGVFGGKVTSGTGGFVLVGDDFRLDGIPIEGLTTIGSEVNVTVPLTSSLTGTLADGTPISMAYISDDDDRIHRGPITLRRANVPLGDDMILLPGEPTPLGVHKGQNLVVGEGAAIGKDFHAGAESIVRVQGGHIGEDFEAAGGVVEISSGSIGNGFNIFAGTEVRVLGGSIGSGTWVNPGARVEVVGGVVGSLYMTGSHIDIRGGSILSLSARRPGVHVVIHGEDFALNGVPLTELENIDDKLSSEGSLLSGTLSNGTPFVFPGRSFAEETLTLVHEPAPPVEQTDYDVPTDRAPPGVRHSQKIDVHAGGTLDVGFNAGRGSELNLVGGNIGDYLTALGATVNIQSGVIGLGFDAFTGTTVRLNGGQIGAWFYAGPQTHVEIAGGAIGKAFRADEASVVVSGGKLAGLHAGAGTNVIVRGGEIGIPDGGPSGMLYADADSTVEFIGTEFLINGSPIPGLREVGDSIVVSERNGESLQGVLLDGSPIDFVLHERLRVMPLGNFSPAAELRLTLAVPEPCLPLRPLLVLLLWGLRVLRQRRTLCQIL